MYFNTIVGFDYSLFVGFDYSRYIIYLNYVLHAKKIGALEKLSKFESCSTILLVYTDVCVISHYDYIWYN